MFRVRISRIDHVECVGFCNSIHCKCPDILRFRYNGIIQEADADPCRHQRFDRYKATDGYFSAEVAEFIPQRGQSFFENTAGTGSLLTDNNGLLQQALSFMLKKCQ